MKKNTITSYIVGALILVLVVGLALTGSSELFQGYFFRSITTTPPPPSYSDDLGTIIDVLEPQGTIDPVEIDFSEILDVNMNSSTTRVDLTATTAFKVGGVIKIENELMYITAVVGDNLTVIRGYSRTTPVSHNTGDIYDNGVGTLKVAPN